jgi:hypothetical protein
LFRALDRERVRYLVISGQACILYGASPFTEDIDLCVPMGVQNWFEGVNRLPPKP